jgi:GT2 family glycosyltransferase
MRRSLVDEAGRFRLGFEGSQDYDLILRATELTSRIGHIDKPLYSWRKVPGSAATSLGAKPYARESAKKALREALSRRGWNGEVLDGFGGFYRVRYDVPNSPLVSIIIPTKDRVDMLKRCIGSIQSKTAYRNYEIIIVDNNSTDPDTLAYLDSVPHKVVRFDEPFNFSRINNIAARHAQGDHLVFLNNDTEVAERCWLEAMVEHSQRSEVGMVGALLIYPSRRTQMTVQHAGVILGLGGVANHAFARLQIDHPNYFGLHRVIRNCSAVTAACAMMRRSVFDEIGGFDEKLKVAFGDVDLGLRVREKGYRVVYAPNAVLYHHECATRGKLHPSEDETYMINKWKQVLVEGDPYYSPNLTLLREDHSIAPKGSTIRPLAVLLEIYYVRPDLQRAFPEARNGDYQRLVDWAAVEGLTIDGARVPLRPYGSYYASHASDPTKPLATLVDLYNSRVELQRDYPEVLRGHCTGLIRWANQVLADNGKGQQYSALKRYEATYRSLSA